MIDTATAMPKVSVLIRTYRRVNVLERAVKSVQEQTYPNIEVVVVEDGENTAEKMLRTKFPDMDIKYHCFGKNQGRSRAGNCALSISSGAYCNFLDDDDQLYPQHLQKLVEMAKKTKTRMTYAQALEIQIDNKTHKPKREFVRHKIKPNRLLLCAINYLPIQCVLFERSLFVEHGGFDVNMDALEDWDLWLRYIQSTRLSYVPEITSEYYTPYKSVDKTNRDRKMKLASEIIKERAKSYQMDISTSEVISEMAYILSEYKRTGLFFYLRKIRDLCLYHDT